MKKRILIDARMHDMSGIGTYTRHLIEEWMGEEDLEISLLGNKEELSNNYPDLRIYNFNEKIYSIKEQIKFPYKIAKEYDELFIPHYNIPIFYKGNLTSTIHDLIHIRFPEYFSKLAVIYAKGMLYLNMKKCQKVITVSNFSKEDIIKEFGEKYRDKIDVRYNKVDEIYKKIEDNTLLENARDKYSISKDKKILLYVGNKKPHKNLKRLIEAFGMLEKKEEYRLVLTGEGFENYTELEEIASELNLNKYIIHTGKVPIGDLVLLYNIADLFVFPSLYEGFGIPPLEALACGTPVVCSTAASIPEVIGEKGVYFDALCILDIKNKMEGSRVNEIKI